MSNTDGPITLETKKQPGGCRDPLFAVLFYANVGIIIALAVKYGADAFASAEPANDESGTTSTSSLIGFLYAALSSGGISIVLSGLMIVVILALASILIKIALIFNVVVSGLMAIFGIITGNIGFAIFGFIIFAIMACYAKVVWSRIPFATANLVTGTKAIKSNCGVTFIGYFMVALAFGWSALWVTAFLGVQDSIITCTTTQNDEGTDVTECTDPNYFILFLMLISYFFTHQVLKNVVHVTVAGVVGTWWFTPEEKGCCGKAIFGSLIRALTTSFGSICFGSLIVAIIQALRTLVDVLRSNDEVGAILACCLDCILGCLESIVEYFNKWAFIYVGLYGYGYCEAGKSVITLFKERGWDAIIADDLVGLALGFLNLIVGLITGGFSILVVSRTSWFAEFIEQNGEDTTKILSFIIGLIVGLVMSSILLSSIDSSVLAVIVLFAEAPAEFEENYPSLSRKMRDAYSKAHPSLTF